MRHLDVQVGVTAYNGAVSVLAVCPQPNFLCSSFTAALTLGILPSVLLETRVQDASLAATASGIGAVEAMHAAVVRYQLFMVMLSVDNLLFYPDIVDR